MTLTEIIAALKQATGPSEELDRLIHFHVVHPWLAEKCVKYWWDLEEDGGFYWLDTERQAAKGPGYHDYVKPVTSSIDAALTLVPEGDWWGITQTPRESNATCAPVGKPGGDGHDATTPALALCIAALSSRLNTGSS